MNPATDINPIIQQLINILNNHFKNANLNVVMINVYYPASKLLLDSIPYDRKHYGQRPHKDDNKFLGNLGK